MRSVDGFSVTMVEAPSQQRSCDVIGLRGKLANEWYYDPRGNNGFGSVESTFLPCTSPSATTHASGAFSTTSTLSWNDFNSIGFELTTSDISCGVDWGQSDKGVGEPL